MKAVLSAFDGVLAAEKAKGLDVTSPEPWQEELADISNPRMYVFMTTSTEAPSSCDYILRQRKTGVTKSQ